MSTQRMSDAISRRTCLTSHSGGQLKIKVIAIVVALVLLVVGLVAAWFILNGDNHGGGSDNQDWPNKTDIDNVPFGNSTTQNSTSKNSAAQSDIVYIRVL